jgi:hypothetical protein
MKSKRAWSGYAVNSARPGVDGGVLLATLGWEAWTGSDPNWLGGWTEMWRSHADRRSYRDWLQAARV